MNEQSLYTISYTTSQQCVCVGLCMCVHVYFRLVTAEFVRSLQYCI